MMAGTSKRRGKLHHVLPVAAGTKAITHNRRTIERDSAGMFTTNAVISLKLT